MPLCFARSSNIVDYFKETHLLLVRLREEKDAITTLLNICAYRAYDLLNDV
jgi:hypothetical protein